MSKHIYTQICDVRVTIIIDDDNYYNPDDILKLCLDDIPIVSTTMKPVDYHIPDEPFVQDDVKVEYEFANYNFDFIHKEVNNE